MVNEKMDNHLKKMKTNSKLASLYLCSLHSFKIPSNLLARDWNNKVYKYPIEKKLKNNNSSKFGEYVSDR